VGRGRGESGGRGMGATGRARALRRGFTPRVEGRVALRSAGCAAVVEGFATFRHRFEARQTSVESDRLRHAGLKACLALREAARVQRGGARHARGSCRRGGRRRGRGRRGGRRGGRGHGRGAAGGCRRLGYRCRCRSRVVAGGRRGGRSRTRRGSGTELRGFCRLVRRRGFRCRQRSVFLRAALPELAGGRQRGGCHRENQDPPGARHADPDDTPLWHSLACALSKDSGNYALFRAFSWHAACSRSSS
jgi:hypothetical protein